ncbi:Yos1-like protein [Sistotremastrum niveocremeum HHB9708]|uniref:Yos1-like protein n=2 Tax=Sistotremastraceae TaxID=3402574 RepID=A0A164S7Q8_9AGAM|nr:Yos1-like protein [Sistotremastrum niveocremeum HHB9708]KZT36706.1 Yos1-like protein [Sistotremastrum suecicum HHB10207 ss-3]
MGLGIGTMINVSLLLVNAIAILNEERFLARIGWSSSPTAQSTPHGFQNPYDSTTLSRPEDSIKNQMVNLIGAVRTLLRMPLIFVNLVVIVYHLIMG